MVSRQSYTDKKAMEGYVTLFGQGFGKAALSGVARIVNNNVINGINENRPLIKTRITTVSTKSSNNRIVTREAGKFSDKDTIFRLCESSILLRDLL